MKIKFGMRISYGAWSIVYSFVFSGVRIDTHWLDPVDICQWAGGLSGVRWFERHRHFCKLHIDEQTDS